MTGERVGRLHLPPGAGHFASRKAHGLKYACQSEDVYDRAARRSRKLWARLGGDNAPFRIPLKPKGMRWTSYARLFDRMKKFDSMADQKLLKQLTQLKARGLI